MTDNNTNINVRYSNSRRGIALLIVLFIVGAISILALGFAVKADTELLCGKNVEFRMEMDYLSLTSLNYAKSMIINPQDATTGANGYWQGDTELQIEEGDDYFDIEVVRSVTGDTPESTFDVGCKAYRMEGGVRISEVNLQAQLRLDSCIAYWAGSNATMHSRMTVFGDTYCNGDLINNGKIYGDVFTKTDRYFGWQTGQVVPLAENKVSWSGIYAWRFEPNYYIDRDSYYPVFLSRSSYANVVLGPTAGNPAGIYYHYGNLDLYGNVKINGTLIVTGGCLKFENADVAVASLKNYPAIVVESEMQFKNSKAAITGLVQVNKMKVFSDSGNIAIVGGLFVKDGGVEVESGYAGNIVVRGDPMKASIKLMSTSVNMMEWSPVGGAYYKHIRRN